MPYVSRLCYDGSSMNKKELSVVVRAGVRVEKVACIGTYSYRVWVHTQPEKGAANERALALLAAYLGIKQSRLTITRGTTRSHKWIRIEE